MTYTAENAAASSTDGLSLLISSHLTGEGESTGDAGDDGSCVPREKAQALTELSQVLPAVGRSCVANLYIACQPLFIRINTQKRVFYINTRKIRVFLSQVVVMLVTMARVSRARRPRRSPSSRRCCLQLGAPV